MGRGGQVGLELPAGPAALRTGGKPADLGELGIEVLAGAERRGRVAVAGRSNVAVPVAAGLSMRGGAAGLSSSRITLRPLLAMNA